MHLQQRIVLLGRLGEYMLSDDEEWRTARRKAEEENGWFLSEFIQLQVSNIVQYFLKENLLKGFADQYNFPDENTSPKQVGIIMAGNIPLVGFHDFLCTFLSGHRQTIKLSSRDAVMLPHLVNKMIFWDAEVESLVSFSQILKGCDAYIATGSDNSSRYFDYYFKKYPHIIRRNRTSAAVLDGTETSSDLDLLADDVHQFFGLGCRNVTKLFVPNGYDFVPLLDALRKYSYLFDHNKYRNNYDYQLAVLIINKRYYMTNGSVILVEDPVPYSPISVLHYEFYSGDRETVVNSLSGNDQLQCLVGDGQIQFGKSQQPSLSDFADGVDTMEFLRSL
jgi:hypothetical protein